MIIKTRQHMVLFCALTIMFISLVVLVIGEDAAAEEPVSEDWPMFRLNLNHTACKEGIAPDTNDTLWKFDTGSNYWVVSSPMIVDDYVYIGSDNGYLYKLYLDNGTEVWKYNVKGGSRACMAQFWSSACVDRENNMVFVHADGVHAINMTTGEKIWHFATKNREFCSPVIHDGVVFVGSYDQHVYALPEFDPNGDGTIDENEVIWYYETGEYQGGSHIDDTGGAVSTTLLIVDNMVIGAEQTRYSEENDYCDYNLFALPEVDPDSSGVIEHDEIVWKYKIGDHIPIIETDIPGEGGDSFSSPSANLELEQVYIGSRDHYFYALELHPDGDLIDNDGDGIIDNEGELCWRYLVDNEIFSSPGIHNGNVYFGSGEYRTSASPGSVYALNETNGELVWRYQGADGFLSSPLIADGKVYIGSNDNYLTAFNENNGSIVWRYKSVDGGSQKAFGSSPSLYDEKIVVGCCNRIIYCFKTPNRPPDVKLLLPEDHSRVSKAIVLKWKGIDPDRGDIEKLRYDVYLAEGYNLVNGSDIGALVSRDQEDEKLALTDLREGRTYYWKVVVNDTEFENESGVRSFEVNRRPEVRSISPWDNTRIISTTINLTWRGSDEDKDNLTYDIYLDESPDPTTCVSCNQTEESFEAFNLIRGRIYYWKVVVNDEIDESVSDIWNFTVNSKPDLYLISPEDGATSGTTYVTLRWEANDMEENDLSYDLYLDMDSDPGTLVAGDLSEKYFEVSDLNNGKTYYWKVVASDGYEESVSDIRDFTVEIAIPTNNPPTIELVSPEDGANSDTTYVTLQWEANDMEGDDLSYDIYLDTDPDPGTLMAEGLNEESYAITDLENGMVYNWKIIVSDGLDETESAIWSFCIDTGFVSNHPPEVILIYPQDGITITSDTINLAWSGNDEDGDKLSYDVYLGTDPNASIPILHDLLHVSCRVPGLEGGKSYYWKVVASDGENEGSSPVWHFIVQKETEDDDGNGWYEGDEPLYLGGITAVAVAGALAVVYLKQVRKTGEKEGDEEDEEEKEEESWD